MGREGKESTSNALPVQLDAQGKIKYDILARQGHSKDKVIHFILYTVDLWLVSTEVYTFFFFLFFFFFAKYTHLFMDRDIKNQVFVYNTLQNK
jgi:hypothetical protein